MKVWFFVLVTIALLVAAPRAAGAGVEVSGLGGPMLVGGEASSVVAGGTLRIHVTVGPSLSYGIDAAYAGLPTERHHFPASRTT